MKPQDILFFIILAFLVYNRDPRLAAACGLLAILISIPLFANWVFFTAERLTWYAAAFFLVSIVLYLLQVRSKKN